MHRVFTDRSRIEAYQRCARLRFLEYHQSKMGITSARKPLPLAVGGSVHVGLEVLLREGSKLMPSGLFPISPAGQSEWDIIEEAAVCGALQDFAQFKAKMQIDTSEGQVVPEAQSMFDEYLFKEQSALVEALVRAYARRRLRPLLEQFEVLEIEREGEWKLHAEPHHIHTDDYGNQKCVWCGFEPATNRDFDAICYVVMFMSRPDALLLERATQQLYLQSYKTAASWDVRKSRDAEHDMQGLSEGIEVERRLAEWWENAHAHKGMVIHNVNRRLIDYLVECDAPPRVHAVRYEYMLKGERWRDKELSAIMGFDCRSQRSPLVRGYTNTSDWNCSWDYLKPDGTGEASKLNYRAWRSEPIWESMTIRQWIDKLADSGEAISGDTGQPMGVRSAAQSTGFLAKDPLDEIFIPPVVVYRNEDDLRDLVEQMESQEQRVAENVALVEAAGDDGERRSLMNMLFPQTRRACEYPTTCAMAKICYGGEDIRRDPLGSGLYQLRVPNHPQEVAK